MSEENTNTTQNDGASSISLKRLIPFLIILAVMLVGFIFLRDVLSFENLAKNQEALQSWRDQNFLVATLVFITIYIVMVAFSLPGASLASIVGGFLFGLVYGSTFNVVSATIGASAIFIAARFGFGEALSAKMDSAQGAVKNFKDSLREDEVSYLLIMRLVPAVPFFVANLLPAVVGVSLSRFIWTTALGIIPGTVVYTWIGVGLSEILAKGEIPNFGIIFEPHVLGPLLGLAVLSALPIAIKKLKK